MKQKVSNWSKYPKKESEVKNFRGEFINGSNTIARGMGRCYGDAALSDNILSTLNHNLLLSFNEQNGELTCQAGVTLKDILDVFVPKGWFVPVTPGTKFITVGGALASDVHGKNHHVEGCFGDHVTNCSLITADGSKIDCSSRNNKELFNATRGGMGLTGIIDTVTFKLKKIETSYINQRQIKAKNLSHIFELFEQYKDHTYSMAWIDCLKQGEQFGRSIMMMGEHSKMEDLNTKQKKNPLSTGKGNLMNMPINLPPFALNKLSIKVFNWLYYAKNTKQDMEGVVHYDGFFYPLDAILNWNRMYGKKGFVQYQFVLPIDNSEDGLKTILKKISEKGWGSFLAVLKLFGKQDSLISFPMEGYTLALDFPIKKGLFKFLDELDEVVISLGGRIYLSKDARMKANTFWESYPNSKEFIEIVKNYNPEFRISSDLSKRLAIH
ncbi:FAD-binding protein [Marivirga sp.]|uniref:FAD-binding protein n=1 Tax=Marivirga sp. TaxID=2018662 RepID=UPI003DA76F77